MWSDGLEPTELFGRLRGSWRPKAGMGAMAAQQRQRCSTSRRTPPWARTAAYTSRTRTGWCAGWLPTESSPPWPGLPGTEEHFRGTTDRPQPPRSALYAAFESDPTAVSIWL